MTQCLRLAIAQMPCRLQDTQANMAEACRLSQDAAAQGARLILLPEGCLTGNALSDPDKQASLPMDSQAFSALQAVADQDDITICAGFATPMSGTFNIVHAIVRPRAQIRFQRKAARADTEPDFLSAWPDATREILEVQGVRVGIFICSEAGNGQVQAAMAAAAPDLILHPSAGRLRDEQVAADAGAAEVIDAFQAECEALITRARAKTKARGVPTIAANPIGFDGEVWWPGNSYGLAADGELLIWLKGENVPARMQPAAGVADLHLD